MAGEFRRKGVTVSLGAPVLGPLGRIALGGRNWEGFGVDPYLSGILGAQTVKGTQDGGIISCTKVQGVPVALDSAIYYMLTVISIFLETSRKRIAIRKQTHEPTTQLKHPHPTWMTRQCMKCICGPLRMLFMLERLVSVSHICFYVSASTCRRGLTSRPSVCSYERLNNSYACQNSKLLNGILKTELGFQGFVMTDWYGHRSGVASALSGLDMAMPLGSPFWGSELVESVLNGSVPESTLENMATRILASWYYSHQDDPSLPSVGVGLPADLLSPHEIVDVRDPKDATTLMEGAIQGHVLVKNVDKALPLRKPRMIAVFGYDAKTPEKYNPGTGKSWDMGLESNDYETTACGYGNDGGKCPPFNPIANGTLMAGGGSGSITPSYLDSPLQSLARRARQDGTQLFWDVINSTSIVPGSTDACLVFINAVASEGVDRPNLRDDYSDGWVKNVASQCQNTIVVVHNAGIRLVDQWIDHPNVTATILAHLPGQDSGDALTQILYGDVSPSGKLPYTLARNESDYGAIYEPIARKANSWDRYYPQDNYTEGVYIDYRAFDENDIEPRFEFGFGLTYTTFKYSNLKIKNTVDPSSLSPLPVGDIIPGGHSDLWDTIATVTADVTNTGDVPAAEVGQLYVTIPGDGQPMRQLRGFDKVMVHPGETKTFEFELRRRDLSVWDLTAQQWRLLTGSEYKLSVGASSRQLLLNATLSF